MRKAPTIKKAIASVAPKHIVAAHAAGDEQRLVRVNFEIAHDVHLALKMKALQEGKSIKDVMLGFVHHYIK